jgi:hypothetical protein
VFHDDLGGSITDSIGGAFRRLLDVGEQQLDVVFTKLGPVAGDSPFRTGVGNRDRHAIQTLDQAPDRLGDSGNAFVSMFSSVPPSLMIGAVVVAGIFGVVAVAKALK